LVEIQNGLKKDTADIRINMLGHNKGLQACDAPASPPDHETELSTQGNEYVTDGGAV